MQKSVLNGLEDDFKLETEIEKKGLLTKSYEIKDLKTKNNDLMLQNFVLILLLKMDYYKK